MEVKIENIKYLPLVNYIKRINLLQMLFLFNELRVFFHKLFCKKIFIFCFKYKIFALDKPKLAVYSANYLNKNNPNQERSKPLVFYRKYDRSG